MHNTLNDLGTPSESLLAWVRQLVNRALTQSAQDQAYIEQLFKFIPHSFQPGANQASLYTLPELCCQACGGKTQLSRPIAAAWHLLLLAAKLLDDVEDRDIKDDVPITINSTTGLHFLIQLILGELVTEIETADCFQPIILELGRTMLRACAGQHADLLTDLQGQKEVDPDGWLDIARAKSGEFFGWAAWAGARVAGATKTNPAEYRTFGYHLGILLQIADDFNDIWSPHHQSDLATGRPSLPVSYALLVSEKETQNHLEMLLSQTQSGIKEAEEKIRQILIEIGAQSYVLVVARTHYLQALAALQQADPAPEPGRALHALLDQILPAVNFDSPE